MSEYYTILIRLYAKTLKALPFQVDQKVGSSPQGQKALSPDHSKELADFRAETEAVLASQPGELTPEVFAPE
jgi:hypothetical protein